MKKMTFLACAALLASACMFTACKKDKVSDELQQAPQSGSYNGEEVKTQFSIALPNQLNGPARMPSSTVQNAGVSEFQGMTGITLIPFAKEGTITSSDMRLGDNITTAKGESMTVSPSDFSGDYRAKVYEDVSIPLSTASFLFYAKSAAAGTKFEVGSLLASDMTLQPSTFSFRLEQIKSDAVITASSKGQNLLDYLTSIANANDGATPTPKKWCDYEAADNASMAAMFATFSTIHGLSSFEVARVLTDLNKSLAPLVSSNTLAANIAAAIAAGSTYVSVNGTTHEVTMTTDYNNFPGEYNLPDGSIDIAWDATTNPSDKKFVEGLYSNMAAPTTYTYPAQLWYYVNSTIQTSNKSQKTAYDGSNAWSAILALHTDAAAVNSRTRAVAIVDPIQYAVARLDVQVRVAETGSGKLEDNSYTVEGARKDVAVNAAGFPISAVLVGGQRAVNFDFTAQTSGTEYTIYDNAMASTYKGTPVTMAAKMGSDYSEWNHTLVLENGTSDVMIAVEMTNNTGVDFYGAGGQLIPKDGKFYVVGKLTASAATETGSHVFKQDFVTKAKLTLTDLKKAYNTIPDLRTPQMELGFSVNLEWQNGHVYTIDFTE